MSITSLIALLSLALMITGLTSAQAESVNGASSNSSSYISTAESLQANITERLSGPQVGVMDVKRNLAEITDFKWIGSDGDKVGNDSVEPDGKPDGHFNLSMHFPIPTVIRSISIYVLDSNGERTSDAWHTSYEDFHILGVFDRGRAINRQYASPIGVFSGDVNFDLYEGDHESFEPGKLFLVQISLSGGKMSQGIAIMDFNGSQMNNTSIIDAWNNMGVFWSHFGYFQKAIKCYDKVIELAPKNGIPWNNKGDSIYRFENVNQALACFNRSIELDQNNAVAWSNKGVAFATLGRYNESLNCCNRALGLNYSFPEAWNGKGVVLAKIGELNESLDCFYRATILSPDYGDAWFNGGLVLHEMGLETRSRTAFEKARILGYSQTEHDYYMQTIPIMMKESSKKLEGLSGALSVAILFASSRLVLRKRF